MGEPVSYQLQGQNGSFIPAPGGGTWAAATNGNGNNVREIRALADTTLTAVDGENMNGVSNLNGAVIPAGSSVFGTFTEITTSGACVLYY